MTIDEVDFFDRESNSAAFMHLRRSDGEIAIGLATAGGGDLDLTVSVYDARRLAERLLAAADEVAAGS